MWQSWQPAFTPVRLVWWPLAWCSFATHCIEWHAVPQNLSVPVTYTITWVPAVATNPMMTPTTRSASTDHRALGRVSARQVRLITPPSPAAIGFSLEAIAQDRVEDVRLVLRARVDTVQVAVLVRGTRDRVLVAFELGVAVLVLL